MYILFVKNSIILKNGNITRNKNAEERKGKAKDGQTKITNDTRKNSKTERK